MFTPGPSAWSRSYESQMRSSLVIDRISITRAAAREMFSMENLVAES
jgi:hypothetical protein